MADLSVFERLKSKQDYDRMEQEFQLKKQLAQAELKKQSYVDVDKIGEQAFMKAAMGQQLSPREQAAMQYVDAKSGGIGFDPATQNVYQKPRISERMGVSVGAGAQKMSEYNIPQISMDQIDGGFMPQAPSMPPPAPSTQSPSISDQVKQEYENKYRQALESARGNAKLTQEIQAKYFKDTTEMNESQSKAAEFSNRVLSSEPILADTKKAEEAAKLSQKVLSNIPLIGNYVVSSDAKSFNQAQRDFINAVLRRESGAAIAKEEFENASQQYFPQPGDDAETLAQKKKNRETTIRGIVTSAGPAYTPPPGLSKPSTKSETEKTILNAIQAVKKGKDPDAIKQRLIEAGIDPKKAGL